MFWWRTKQNCMRHVYLFCKYALPEMPEYCAATKFIICDGNLKVLEK